MCQLYLEGTCAVVDMSRCPFEFASPAFIDFHLKDLSSQDAEIKTIRYKEMAIELDESRTSVLMQYADIIKQIEQLLLRTDIYGLKEDPNIIFRRKLTKNFYEEMFVNPLAAAEKLFNYKEEPPKDPQFTECYKKFKEVIKNILNDFRVTKLYELVKKTGDLRAAFLSLTNLRSLNYVDLLIYNVPEDAKPLKKSDAHYTLLYGYEVQIYEIPGIDSYLYTYTNPVLESLSPYLKNLLKQYIDDQMKESFERVSYDIIMLLKAKDYCRFFLDRARRDGQKITPREALVMGHEAAAWVVGLGCIENFALDKENIADIYVASNKPIAIEHVKYGFCRTLLRCNADMLSHAFKNALLTLDDIKFDERSPVADVVVKRLSMRCHLQHPAATFGEYQGSFKIIKEQLFTYPQYLNLHSFPPFYAGYDDVLVSLGCNEAVLGLKGTGKTSFMTAKITAIGTKKRIEVLQDIKEIPLHVIREYGFYITNTEIDNSAEIIRPSSLNMPDVLIVQEPRTSKTVDLIVKLINTQPNTTILYNLHAEKLGDIKDKLIPTANMFITDRYTFLKKVRFGRRGIMYRMLNYEYESDQEKNELVEVFRLKIGESIDKCVLECKFLRNPEATAWDFDKVDLKKLEKELDIIFIPPTIAKISKKTGIPPEHYILRAFFKGKVYYSIYKAGAKNNKLLEPDFVLKVNSYANKLLDGKNIDFNNVWKKFYSTFKKMLKK